MKKQSIIIAIILVIAIVFTSAAALAVPESADVLTLDSTKTVTLSAGETRYYSFSPAETAMYCITSYGKADTYLSLYDSSNALLVADDESGENGNFSLVYPLKKGQMYYYAVSICDGSAGNFEIRLTNSGSTVKSGTCGDNLSWSLDCVSGLLTVSGAGIMDNYSTQNSAPWFEYRQFITSISLGDKVQSVGSYAFYYCTKLTQVSGGKGLTELGEYSFSRTGLKKITLGTAVSTIGEYAFSYCTALESADIGSAEAIGTGAFEHCENLSSISFGSQLVTIGDYAFTCCEKLSAIELTESVRRIGDYAFSRCGLVSASLGGTNTIGKAAFYHCAILTDITVPATVRTIGERAFASCNALTDVIFLGNAPYVIAGGGDNSTFDDVTVYYYPGRTGWTSPTWKGYSAKAKFVSGDVNGDGVLSNADLVIISRSIVGLETLTNEQKMIADTNGDGAVSNSDLVIFARRVVGLEA